MTFNKNRAGDVMYLVNGAVYHVNDDGRFAYAGADTGTVVTVTLTGWTETTTSGYTLYQTTGGGWIDLMDGWKSRGKDQYSTRSAQSYVNTIIKNNKQILQNNLVCARFAYLLSYEQQTKLRGLQNRLSLRNESLQNDGLVSNIETSYPQGYADLAQYLNSFMAQSSVSGIGVVITTTAVIVISAIVVASLGTAAYFAYKYMAAESEQDVKFSNELTRTLTAKLTAEEYEQLRSETAGIVTKAKLMQSLNNFGTITKVLLIGAGLFGINYLYKNYIKK